MVQHEAGKLGELITPTTSSCVGRDPGSSREPKESRGSWAGHAHPLQGTGEPWVRDEGTSQRAAGRLRGSSRHPDCSRGAQSRSKRPINIRSMFLRYLVPQSLGSSVCASRWE